MEDVLLHEPACWLAGVWLTFAEAHRRGFTPWEPGSIVRKKVATDRLVRNRAVADREEAA